MQWRIRARFWALAVAVGAAVVALGVADRTAPVRTGIGTASVVLDTDAARAVERVDYRQDVERLGDVLVDGEPIGSLDDPVLAEAWAAVDRVWPVSRRATIAQISVIREGPLGLVGVVHPSASTDGWILSLDAADLADTALVDETIAHEIVHVVTLDTEGFAFGGGDADCDGVTISIGCAASGTTLARFAERFWPDGAAADHDEAAFATTYARSAVHEDLAETFLAWTFDWPVPEGGTLEAKILLLATDADLVALRAELRDRLPPA